MEWVQVLLSGVAAAVTSTILSYFKEKKFASSKYAERVLTELYIPIYRMLREDVLPGDGYEGLNMDQVNRIDNVAKKNPELTDPRLDEIVNAYMEVLTSPNYPFVDELEHVFDQDRKLFTYIMIAFNRTRKSLGLPYDKDYVYPLLSRIKSLGLKRKVLRVLRKLKRKV